MHRLAPSALLLALSALLLALSALASPAHAQPAPSQLAALAPPAIDDARLAVAIGPAGEVYEPDGKGAWIRRQRITTATAVSLAARSGSDIVALGEGVVYRLAPNGWSAIRLHQKNKAKLAGGGRAVAAVGRQLFALDRLVGGEPAKLGAAPGDVALLGAGATIVVGTDRGLFRLDGGRLEALTAPRRPRMLVGDQWAITDGAAVDLRSGRATPWPDGAAIEVAAAGPDDRLIAVSRAIGTLELLTLRAGKLERAPVALTPAGAPVGVTADRAGRVVIALRDGRLAVRDGAAWTTVTVAEQLPAPRPGPSPATSR
jgi:hypothetical protein